MVYLQARFVLFLINGCRVNQIQYITIATEGSETLSAGTRTGASTLVFGSHVGTAVHLFTDGSNWYDIIQD